MDAQKIKILSKDDLVPQIINDLIQHRDEIHELAVTYVTKGGKIHTRFSHGTDRMARIGMFVDMAHEIMHA